MSVEIRKVNTKKDLDAFIQFHYDLYRGNQYDAPNLYSDEVHTLSKDRNAAFEFCEAEYFLAYKDGKLCGRIAGIVNALTGIFFKLGMALGGVVPGAVLAIVGFDANLDKQTPFAEQGILWLVCVIPAILLLLSIWIISKYELEDDVIDKINKEIEARSKAK